MKLWKQIILSVLVAAGAFVAWANFFPESEAFLARYGIDWVKVSSTSEQSAAGPGGGAPQAAPGGRAPGASGPGGGQRGGFSRETLVVVAEAGDGVVNDRLTAIGSGQVARTVTIRPLDQGQIVELPVSSGDEVAAGDIILRLISDEQELAVERARLAVADATEKSERLRSLVARNAISTVEADAADSALRSAEVGLREAEIALEKRTVKAPISGVLGILAVNAGDYVTTQSDITTIDDLSNIRVEFFVPERFSANMKKGAPVRATATALPGEQLEGTVSAVDNRIDEASRTLRVQADIPNDDGRLRAGMSFTVSMRFEGDSYPSVDPLAIQWDSSGPYVWRVNEGKAERVNVAIVQRNAESVLVSAEISAGDRIVTEGVQNVRQGAAVRIAGAPPAEAGTASSENRPPRKEGS